LLKVDIGFIHSQIRQWEDPPALLAAVRVSNRDIRIAYLIFDIVSRTRRDLRRALEAHGPISPAISELGVTSFGRQSTRFSGRIAYLLTRAAFEIDSHSASDEEDASRSMT
jgi:predicted secreted Zn-dependent protease